MATLKKHALAISDNRSGAGFDSRAAWSDSRESGGFDNRRWGAHDAGMDAMYLKTGLRTCHGRDGERVECAGTGQDAETRPGREIPEPRFEISGESDQGGAVLDRLTGLIWTRSAAVSGFPTTWDEARALAEGLNADSLGGRADWRLPNRREMRSLIDYSRRDPALPEGHPFADVHPGWCWTSTPWAGNADYAWRVHTEGGRMFFGRRDDYSLAWLVAGRSPILLNPLPGGDGTGAAWSEDRFEDRGGWVLDRATGLAWTRDANLFGPLLWTEALNAAREVGKRLGLDAPEGFSAWALPTINELETLCDAARRDPALPRGHPFENVGEVYHSSTTSGYEPDWCMALYMHKGAVGVGYKPDAAFNAWFAARPKP